MPCSDASCSDAESRTPPRSPAPYSKTPTTAAARAARAWRPGARCSPGVTVELYAVTGGVFIATTTTNASGVYSFDTGACAASVIVRVVNGSVRSARTGGAGVHHVRARADVSHRRQQRHGGGRHQSRGWRDAGLERRGRESRCGHTRGRSRRVAACRSPSPPPTPAAHGIDDQRHRFRIQLRHRGEHARLHRLRRHEFQLSHARDRCGSSSSTPMRWVARVR